MKKLYIILMMIIVSIGNIFGLNSKQDYTIVE